MKVEIENQQGHFKKVSVVVPSDKVNETFAKHFEEVRKQVTLKGFRKGKAPLDMIKKSYSESVRPDVLREVINDSLVKAFNEHSLKPVSSPQVEIQNFQDGGDLSFSAVFENTPPVNLKKYTGFKAEKFDAKIDNDEMQKTLKNIQNAFATLEDVPAGTPVAKSHVVMVDYDASEAGAPLANASAKGNMLELGAEGIPPEFEKNLIGMKAGEEKNFTVNYPNATKEEDTFPLAGKKIDYSVKLHNVKQKNVPELNDELAKKVGPFETLQALKDRVSEDLLKQKEANHKNQTREKLVEWIVKENPVDIPETMLTQQMENLVMDASQRLSQMGFEQSVIEERLKQWDNDMQTRAQRQVHASLLLSAIATKESIQATDEDIRKEVARIAVENRRNPKDVFDDFRKRGLLGALWQQVTELKALDWMVAQALM